MAEDSRAALQQRYHRIAKATKPGAGGQQQPFDPSTGEYLSTGARLARSLVTHIAGRGQPLDGRSLGAAVKDLGLGDDQKAEAQAYARANVAELKAFHQAETSRLAAEQEKEAKARRDKSLRENAWWDGGPDETWRSAARYGTNEDADAATAPDYAAWREAMAPDEIEALWLYRSGDGGDANFLAMNGAMRGQTPRHGEDRARTLEVNRAAINALHRPEAALPRDTVLTRTIGNDALEGLGLEVGSVIRDQGFMSTTLIAPDGEQSMISSANRSDRTQVVIRAPKGTKGGYISRLPGHEDSRHQETELLLAPGTELRIDRILPAQRYGRVIEATVVHQASRREAFAIAEGKALKKARRAGRGDRFTWDEGDLEVVSRRRALRKRFDRIIVKHLRGRHDQLAHGRRYRTDEGGKRVRVQTRAEGRRERLAAVKQDYVRARDKTVAANAGRAKAPSFNKHGLRTDTALGRKVASIVGDDDLGNFARNPAKVREVGRLIEAEVEKRSPYKATPELRAAQAAVGKAEGAIERVDPMLQHLDRNYIVLPGSDRAKNHGLKGGRDPELQIGSLTVKASEAEAAIADLREKSNPNTGPAYFERRLADIDAEIVRLEADGSDPNRVDQLHSDRQLWTPEAYARYSTGNNWYLDSGALEALDQFRVSFDGKGLKMGETRFTWKAVREGAVEMKREVIADLDKAKERVEDSLASIGGARGERLKLRHETLLAVRERVDLEDRARKITRQINDLDAKNWELSDAGDGDGVAANEKRLEALLKERGEVESLLSAANERYKAARESQKAAKDRLDVDEARDSLKHRNAVTEVLAEVRPMGGKLSLELDTDMKGREGAGNLLMQTLQGVMRFVPSAWVEGANREGAIKVSDQNDVAGSAGYYSHERSRLVSSQNDPSTLLHEFGHRVQETTRNVSLAERYYFAERTAMDGRDPIPLGGGVTIGGRRVEGYRDEFPDYYMGRVYRGSRESAKEVVTRALEGLYGGPSDGHPPRDYDAMTWMLGVMATL